jgi:hypothetical protein
MSKRLVDLLVLVLESALPFHARPPASIRSLAAAKARRREGTPRRDPSPER